MDSFWPFLTSFCGLPGKAAFFAATNRRLFIYLVDVGVVVVVAAGVVVVLIAVVLTADWPFRALRLQITVNPIQLRYVFTISINFTAANQTKTLQSKSHRTSREANSTEKPPERILPFFFCLFVRLSVCSTESAVHSYSRSVSSTAVLAAVAVVDPGEGRTSNSTC